ncbi:MAG: beta-lactamase family protein, partial [Oscillospiraceae bacterium]|nr:beta-lactamase family protein [Oscillospiraceae bacterium]
MKTDKTVIAAAAAIAATFIAAAMPALALGEEHDAKPAAKAAPAEHVQNIGSVSKMFATTAALQLYEQGKLDIDAPVTDYVPEFTMQDERYKDITVRMLMDHTSGMMGTTYDQSFLYGDNDMGFHDRFLEYLSHDRLKDEPGMFASYCNDGFTLLEHVVEHVSGESFTDYVREHICSPLGMDHTGSPVDMFGRDDHVRVKSDGTDFAADYCMTIGSGGILSTVSDLDRFGSSFFTGNETILSEESKRAMLVPVSREMYESHNGLGWDDAYYEDYDAAGVTVMSKGGATQHQYASLMIAPDEEICISVLMSGENAALP